MNSSYFEPQKKYECTWYDFQLQILMPCLLISPPDTDAMIVTRFNFHLWKIQTAESTVLTAPKFLNPPLGIIPPCAFHPTWEKKCRYLQPREPLNSGKPRLQNKVCVLQTISSKLGLEHIVAAASLSWEHRWYYS